MVATIRRDSLEKYGEDISAPESAEDLPRSTARSAESLTVSTLMSESADRIREISCSVKVIDGSVLPSFLPVSITRRTKTAIVASARSTDRKSRLILFFIV